MDGVRLSVIQGEWLTCWPGLSMAQGMGLTRREGGLTRNNSAGLGMAGPIR
jgi:hypothetical protein